MKLLFYGFTEKGKVRENNQDAILCRSDENSGLFVVADGMGGHHYGDKASYTIIKYLDLWWNNREDSLSEKDFLQQLKELEECIKKANLTIYHQYNNNSICGSTIVLLFIVGDQFAICNCGDSRIYYRNGLRFTQLTVDDTWENQPHISQHFSIKEIKKSHHLGKLIRCVGVGTNVQLTIETGILKNRDCFLLCSDGVYNMCRTSNLKNVMKSYTEGKTKEEIAQYLKRTIFKNGAKDNFSVIIIHYQS